MGSRSCVCKGVRNGVRNSRDFGLLFHLVVDLACGYEGFYSIGSFWVVRNVELYWLGIRIFLFSGDEGAEFGGIGCHILGEVRCCRGI